MRLPRFRVLGALVGTIAVVGCSFASTPASSVAVPQAARSAQLAAAKVAPDTDPQVLVISLDGLNPKALRRLGRTGAPQLWRMIDEGAFTLNARTQVEQTVTLPNHTSMVTGRRIDASRGGHGVTWNDDRLSPPTVQDAAGHDVASVFTQVHARGGRTALYSTKTKFSLWQRSWPTDLDRVGIYEEDDAKVVSTARADLAKADRDLTFVHLGAADKAGHASGWLSRPYLAAVRKLDRLVGLLLADARRKPALSDLTVVLTADHGGIPGATTHTPRNRADDYTIPFVVWGPGIDHRNLYSVNRAYADPRGAQPSLRAKRPPIRNGNVANLALDLLGMGRVPGSIFGRKPALRLHVTAPD